MRWRVVLWFLVGLLVVPALVLTGARIVDSDRSLLVRIVSFVPVGVILYAAALVLLLVLTLACRRGERRLPLVVAIGAAGGLGLHLAWVAPWYVGTSVAAGQEEPLRLMTSNVLGDAGDATGLVELAAEEHVDVLAVEELSTGALAEMERAGIAELFPYRAGEAAAGGVAGTMLFAREPITGVVRLPTTFGSWSARVGDATIFAVHPVYALDTTRWADEHAALLAAADELEPDLLLGDFNATLDHRPMRRLHDAGYRDAAELAGAGWQPTWPADGSGLRGLLPPVIQIDHVLVDDGWTALDTWTHHLAGSDHLALLADVART